MVKSASGNDPDRDVVRDHDKDDSNVLVELTMVKTRLQNALSELEYQRKRIENLESFLINFNPLPRH
ncbi:hypothetical protein GP486_008580, partial [Trichoglossum hirsutum]